MTATPAMASASSSSTLINIAHSYIGSPYSYGGTTAAGFDCSGFTQRVFSDGGSSLPRTTGGQFNVGAPVDKGSLQPGDLVFFNTSGNGVSHVGIYIGSNNFIHASSSGVMISSIHDPHYWGSRYIGARRPNGQPAAQPKAEEVTEEKVEKKQEQPKAEVKKEVKKTSQPVVTQKAVEKPIVVAPVVTPPVQETKTEEVKAEEVKVEVEVESEELLAQIEYTHLHPTALGLKYSQLVHVKGLDYLLLEKII